MDFQPNVVDGLRSLLSNRPAGCTCPTDIADRFRRTLSGDNRLCPTHDADAIALDLERERIAIERDAAIEERRILIEVRDGLRQGYGDNAIPIGDDTSILGILHRELGGTTNQQTEQL